jgi:serine protease
LNCQASGGKAAIIYNNVGADIIFGGTLSTPTRVTIPVLSTSQGDGLRVASRHVGGTGILLFEDGYASFDGTSMATPHVTGAAAAMWRVCRKCQNFHVVNCLLGTAKDLGPRGRDDEYGYGLLQTKAAYDCLNATCCL